MRFLVRYNFFIFFIILNSSSYLYAQHLDYGGEIALVSGNIAGLRSSSTNTAGYIWASHYYKINSQYAVKGLTGLSLERSELAKFAINDLSIGIHHKNHQFTIGRTQNAAGILYHDISDFGAPSGGSDNNPINFFFTGNFPTNTAQNLTQPFANRLSYYIKPYKDYIGIGFSYAPKIETFHALNYQFFANAPTSQELSAAINTEFAFKQFFVAIAGGYTEANRDFNRLRPMGKIQSTQYSVQIQEKLKKKHYFNLYEFNSGCLKDTIQQDCRVAFQISKIKNNYIRNIGTQWRFDDQQMNAAIYSDHYIGWSWIFKPNMTVGLETILRTKESQNTKETDFHWLAGIKYVF